MIGPSECTIRIATRPTLPLQAIAHASTSDLCDSEFSRRVSHQTSPYLEDDFDLTTPHSLRPQAPELTAVPWGSQQMLLIDVGCESTWLHPKIGRGSFIGGVRMAARRASGDTSGAMSRGLYGMSGSNPLERCSRVCIKAGPRSRRYIWSSWGLTELANSTSCLHSGSDCIYPPADQVPQQDLVPVEAHRYIPTAAVNADSSLYSYVGGSFESLPESSKRLLRHCEQPCKNWARYLNC